MKLGLRRSDFFNRDFDLQHRWYLENASEEVARRYLEAVLLTLSTLAAQPGMGRARFFRHPELRGLRSFPLRSPFHVHLLFYRLTDEELFAERILHGMRDLPRRLLEPPGSSEQ
ncbi:MAG: type II toxin-antitoxin system RelE/ParE family toxin [Verrucomicrobia bacterium]|nr:type II toxin-antitoxin system RelE/ParE family toxin [Verrucomicrobiota bacterium]